MSIQITNQETQEALQALEQLKGRELYIPSALRVRAVHRSLKAHWADVEDLRTALIAKYAKLGEDGSPVYRQTDAGATVDFKAGATGLMAFESDWREAMRQSWEQSHGIRLEDLKIQGKKDAEQTIPYGIVLGLGPLVADPPEEPAP